MLRKHTARSDDIDRFVCRKNSLEENRNKYTIIPVINANKFLFIFTYPCKYLRLCQKVKANYIFLNFFGKIIYLFIFWHGVEAMPAPRVAAKNAPQCQPAATPHAPLFDGFDGIMRASRLKPTLVGTQQRRQRPLIESNWKNKNELYHFAQQHHRLPFNLEHKRHIFLQKNFLEKISV